MSDEFRAGPSELRCIGLLDHSRFTFGFCDNVRSRSNKMIRANRELASLSSLTWVVLRCARGASCSRPINHLLT